MGGLGRCGRVWAMVWVAARGLRGGPGADRVGPIQRRDDGPGICWPRSNRSQMLPGPWRSRPSSSQRPKLEFPGALSGCFNLRLFSTLLPPCGHPMIQSSTVHQQQQQNTNQTHLRLSAASRQPVSNTHPSIPSIHPAIHPSSHPSSRPAQPCLAPFSILPLPPLACRSRRPYSPSSRSSTGQFGRISPTTGRQAQPLCTFSQALFFRSLCSRPFAAAAPARPRPATRLAWSCRDATLSRPGGESASSASVLIDEIRRRRLGRRREMRGE